MTTKPLGKVCHMCSMSNPVGGLETIVKFLDLGNLTMLAKVREIVREAKLDLYA